MSKRDDAKKKRDQATYHKKMREMNAAHRMAHKLNTPFERIESYLDEVKGTGDQEPWEDSAEVVEHLDKLLIAMGKAISVLQLKPDSYVPRTPRPKVKLKLAIGTVVAVRSKYREGYSVILDADEMDRLTIVSMSEEGGRVFVRPPDDEGKPIPMRQSEIRIVSGGKPE